MLNMIRISGIIEESVVDGPGIRYVIFTQGCLHNCLNCHNQQTHPLDGGYNIKIDELANNINNIKYYDGVTISGGEPFLQIRECHLLVSLLKDKHIMVYTGFIFEDLLKKSQTDLVLHDLLLKIDLLVDGPYIDSLKSYDLHFKGSKNQRIIECRNSILENKIILSSYN